MSIKLKNITARHSKMWNDFPVLYVSIFWWHFIAHFWDSNFFKSWNELKCEMNFVFMLCFFYIKSFWRVRFSVEGFNSKTFFCFISAVKPTSINITAKPKKFASEMEYTLNCVVVGSIPETDIRWTQNNRPFTRRKVIYNTFGCISNENVCFAYWL